MGRISTTHNAAYYNKLIRCLKYVRMRLKSHGDIFWVRFVLRSQNVLLRFPRLDVLWSHLVVAVKVCRCVLSSLLVFILCPVCWQLTNKQAQRLIGRRQRWNKMQVVQRFQTPHFLIFIWNNILTTRIRVAWFVRTGNRLHHVGKSANIIYYMVMLIHTVVSHWHSN